MEADGLPTGWTLARLDTALDSIVGGGTPSKDVPAYFDGTIPLMTVKDMRVTRPSETGFNITKAALEDSSAKVVPADTVIIATRMGLGKVVRPKMDTAINQDLKALFPSEALDESFLEWWLHSVAHQIEAMGTGTTVKGVRLNEIKALEIPLAPLPEQQRIVEKIETLLAELDKGEEALREVQKLLGRYRQSLLKAAVTGELTADWRAANGKPQETGQELLARVLKQRRESWQGRGRYKEPKEQNGKELPDLPEGWAWVTVDQLLRSDLSNGRSVPDAEEGFPVLRLTALKQGLIDLKERKIGAWDAESASNYLVHQHDVLVSRGNGSKRLVGLGGIVAECPDGIAYPDTMIRIPPLLDFVLPDWFIQIWNSPFMRAQIEAAAKTTAGIYKINQGDIRAFAIPLPPLEEQNAVAALVEEGLSQTKVTENWCKTELKRSTALRQSILKDAFSGNLIPQDPSDEPAEELLERVRTERRRKSKQAQKKALA
jgi:type I restriction enzyme S subunit